MNLETVAVDVLRTMACTMMKESLRGRLCWYLGSSMPPSMSTRDIRAIAVLAWGRDAYRGLQLDGSFVCEGATKKRRVERM